jgi:F0F1-type ATP synthase assembly protein I
MLDKEQAEAVSEALLSPARAAQEAAQKRKDEQRRKLVAQQRLALFVLAGLAIGGAVGYLFYGKLFPSGLVGIALGLAVGYVVRRRAA